MESKYFLKKINSKLLTIIGIILIIVSIIFEVLVVNDYNKEKKGVKHYGEAQNSGEYVYIDVKDFTDYFATYTSDDLTQYYYFLADENYLYIGKLKTTDYNKLPARIYGYTTFITEDLEKIAIESYNEMIEEELVNEEIFTKMFGYYYIDTYRTPSGTLIGFTIPLGIAFIVGVILAIYDLINKSKTKKELNKNNLSDIIKDIDSQNTIVSHTGRLYLTESYILSYKSKLVKINYMDIVWIYPHTEKNRGVTNASIMVMDKNGKIHSIGYMNLTQKTSPEYNELYDSLLNKVPNVLHGYTAENKQKAKEEVNKYKIN